jgi:hypothetical protein
MTAQSILNTKLQNAIGRRHVDLTEIEALLTEGAEVNTVRLHCLVDPNGRTPKDWLNVIELLLNKGADPYRDGGAVLERALGHTLTKRCEGDDRVLDLLLRHKMDVSANNALNLRWAIKMGNIDRLKKLVAHGGRLSLVGKTMGPCAITSAIHSNSSVDLLNYCFDQLQSELSDVDFKAFCNQKLNVWISQAIRCDQIDQLEELITRHKVTPSADFFAEAAKNAATKVMDYLLTFGHPNCDGLLSAVAWSIFSGGDPLKNDACFAPVLEKILAQHIDRTIDQEIFQELIHNGCTHSLKAFSDHGLVDQSCLDETLENQKLAARVCTIAEDYGFEVESNTLPNLGFRTRDNAQSDDSPGQVDLDRAKTLALAIIKEFPGLQVEISSFDEWVLVDVTTKKPAASTQEEPESDFEQRLC